MSHAGVDGPRACVRVDRQRDSQKTPTALGHLQTHGSVLEIWSIFWRRACLVPESTILALVVGTPA